MSDLFGPPTNVHSSCIRLNLSSPTLILKLQDTKLNKTWTQGSPQRKEQVAKYVFFSNPKISLPILDELKKPRFCENREKSAKLKGLEPWIHSKVGGR
jgi:hypothetical protein